MAVDYIPSDDATFDAWQKILVLSLAAAPTNFGLTAADATALSALAATWESKYGEHTTTAQAARGARIAKDATRKEFETLIRADVRRVQAYPGVTDQMRSEIGITVPDASRTPTPVPDAPPMLKVDTSERLTHTVAFFQTTPDGKGTRGKPKGVKGCAIYVKLGSPPTFVDGVPTDVEFLALDTASPYVAAWSTADAGKTAYYVAQWMGGKHGDEPGPWSETVEATIVG